MRAHDRSAQAVSRRSAAASSRCCTPRTAGARVPAPSRRPDDSVREQPVALRAAGRARPAAIGRAGRRSSSSANVRFPAIGDQPYFLSLGPHTFYWFHSCRLKPTARRSDRLVAAGAARRGIGSRSAGSGGPARPRAGRSRAVAHDAAMVRRQRTAARGGAHHRGRSVRLGRRSGRRDAHCRDRRRRWSSGATSCRSWRARASRPMRSAGAALARIAAGCTSGILLDGLEDAAFRRALALR